MLTYLMLKVMNNSLKTVILEINSKLKTKQLNAPKKLGPKETKLWAIEKAYALLRERKDNTSIKIMDKAQKSKRDDLADTIVQIEAVFSLFNLSKATCNQNPNPTKVSSGSTELYNPKYSIGLTVNNIDHKISSPIQLSNFMNDKTNIEPIKSYSINFNDFQSETLVDKFKINIDLL